MNVLHSNLTVERDVPEAKNRFRPAPHCER